MSTGGALGASISSCPRAVSSSPNTSAASPASSGELLGALFHLVLQRTGAAIAEFPDFLRLGLLLILERRPEEPTARAKFVEVRRATAGRVRAFYGFFFTSLGADEIDSLVTLTLALADGLFVAADVDRLDLTTTFDLLATAVLGAARELGGQTSGTKASSV